MIRHLLPWLRVVLICGSLPVSALEPLTLQLKWTHQFQFAGYYAALHQGFYADEGLDVTIRDRSQVADHFNAVLKGDAEYGVSDSSLILHRLNGKPVVALAAIFQHSPLVLMTLKKDGLLGPYELKGRRVMYQKGLDGSSITAMFHQMGIADTDIEYIPHSFDDDALRRGEVDAMAAYLTHQPYYYASLGIPVHIINPNNYGVDFYGDILFTTEQEIRDHPERVAAFKRASLKGWHYALKHNRQVFHWLREFYASRLSEQRMMEEAEATERMIRPDLIDIGHLNPARFARIAEIYRQEGMAPIDAVLEGIDYRDHLGWQTGAGRWALWLGGLSTAMLALALGLLVFNRRLNNMVKHAGAALADAREQQQQYIDIVDKHVLISSTDLDGRITYASDAFCQATQYSREELIGQSHRLIRHPDTKDEVYAHMWETLKAGKSWQGEVKGLSKARKTFWMQVVIDPKLDENGEIRGYTAIRQDITDKKHVEKLSVTDALTGLSNRLHLDRRLAEEMVRSDRYSHPLGILLLDLDFFKRVNDNYGHQVGDAVLVEMAWIIRDGVRRTDLAGRWGGEEFLIICPETDEDGAQKLSEAICQAVRKHEFSEAGHLTCSLGAAVLQPGEVADNMVARADKALYRAKAEGRDQVVVAGHDENQGTA